MVKVIDKFGNIIKKDDWLENETTSNIIGRVEEITNDKIYLLIYFKTMRGFEPQYFENWCNFFSSSLTTKMLWRPSIDVNELKSVRCIWRKKK